jgi:hypothetical protein
VSSNDTRTAKALLSQGYEADTQMQHDFTALHFACAEGSWAVASLLLDHGASVHARTDTGYTPLMHAAAKMVKKGKEKKEKRKLVKRLLELGSDVHATNFSGNTALTAAAMMMPGDDATVMMLLDAGADVNVRNAEGDGVVLAAAITQNLPLLRRVLTECGGVPTAHDMSFCAESGVPGISMMVSTDAWVRHRALVLAGNCKFPPGPVGALAPARVKQLSTAVDQRVPFSSPSMHRLVELLCGAAARRGLSGVDCGVGLRVLQMLGPEQRFIQAAKRIDNA